MEVLTKSFSYEWTFCIPGIFSPNTITLEQMPLFPEADCGYCWKIKFQDNLTTKRLLLECVQNSDCSEILATCHATVFFPGNEKKLCVKNQNKKFCGDDREHELIGDLNQLNLPENTPVRITVYIEAKITKSRQRQLETTDHKRLVSDDIASYVDNPKCSDVLICVGETNLKAHRVILSARSSVFAAMFENYSLEKNSGRIVISDFEAEVVKSFLCYVYSGFVKIPSYKMASNLLRMADKYAVDGLKIFSSEYLASVINKTNCTAILLLSEMYNAPELKKFVLDFFLRLPKSFVKTMSFLEIEENRPCLLTELLKEMCMCSDVSNTETVSSTCDKVDCE